MGADEVAVMYVNQAQVLEGQGKFKEAEKLYISVHEPDLAITMYKKQRQYDQVNVKLAISDDSINFYIMKRL